MSSAGDRDRAVLRAPAFERIPGRYGVTLTRVGDTDLAGRVPLEAHLLYESGSLRTAAVLMAVDMTAGLTSGLSVLPKWSVTADADITIVSACTVGPLRVDTESLRAGRHQSLVGFRAVDEGDGNRLVAIGTANHGVLTPEFPPGLDSLGIGESHTFERPDAPPGQTLEDYFGVAIAAGTVTIPLDERTTNPWGILHGGLTGLLVERAAAEAGLGSPSDVGIRFMRPVSEGPAVAAVVEIVERPGGRVARVELRDRGADRVAVTALVAGR